MFVYLFAGGFVCLFAIDQIISPLAKLRFRCEKGDFFSFFIWIMIVREYKTRASSFVFFFFLFFRTWQ